MSATKPGQKKGQKATADLAGPSGTSRREFGRGEPTDIEDWVSGGAKNPDDFEQAEAPDEAPEKRPRR